MKKLLQGTLLIIALMSLICSNIFAASDIEFYEIDENGKAIIETSEPETTKEVKKKEETKKEEVKKEETKKEVVKDTTPKGSKQVEGKWIVYDNNGKQVTTPGFVTAANKTYYLDAQLNMLTGPQVIQDKMYYFNSDGSQHIGWLQLGEKIFYFNPLDNGAMRTTPGIIDGKQVTFAEDGSVSSAVDAPAGAIDTPLGTTNGNSSLTSKLVFVKGTSRKPIEEMDQQANETRDELLYIIGNLQPEFANLVANNIEAIYVCMNLDDTGKEYLQRASYSYKDEDGEKTTDEEDIPYKYSNGMLYIDGRVPDSLYYGLGAWACRYYKVQNQPVYEYSTWKTIYNNQGKQLDALYEGLGDDQLPFFRGSQEIALASTIGWMLKSPSMVASANMRAYEYVNSFTHLLNTSGPNA